MVGDGGQSCTRESNVNDIRAICDESLVTVYEVHGVIEGHVDTLAFIEEAETGAHSGLLHLDKYHTRLYRCTAVATSFYRIFRQKSRAISAIRYNVVIVHIRTETTGLPLQLHQAALCHKLLNIKSFEVHVAWGGFISQGGVDWKI